MSLVWFKLSIRSRRKTGKTERIRNESNPIWRQTIVYDRIKLVELEEATLTLSIVHRHRARRKLLGKKLIFEREVICDIKTLVYFINPGFFVETDLWDFKSKGIF